MTDPPPVFPSYDPAKRHVLAVDGGGVRGIVALQFLVAFEERSGRKACEAFDLFAGTSTGGIIAAGDEDIRRETARGHDEVVFFAANGQSTLYSGQPNEFARAVKRS